MTGAATHYHNNHIIIIPMLKHCWQILAILLRTCFMC